MKKKTLRAVPNPETPKSRERISRRHAIRLHQLRTEGVFTMPAIIHMTEPRCSECGTEMENTTDGCGHCADRMRNRASALAPDVLERRQERDRIRKRVERERKRAA